MTDDVAKTLIITVGGLISGLLGLLFRRLGDVGGKVDGRYDALEAKVTKYQDEIVKLQQPGATTPYGEPSAAQPVTLTAGKPAAFTDVSVKR